MAAAAPVMYQFKGNYFALEKLVKYDAFEVSQKSPIRLAIIAIVGLAQGERNPLVDPKVHKLFVRVAEKKKITIKKTKEQEEGLEDQFAVVTVNGHPFVFQWIGGKTKINPMEEVGDIEI